MSFIGARYAGNGRTEFRVWAPDRKQVEVALETAEGLSFTPLSPQPGGYFGGELTAKPGARYRYRLDGRDAFPDPASRFQPEGPHGPSEIVDPSTFPWTDAGWRGLKPKGQVLYELHVGAFTPEGTFEALIPKLADLVELGVTCVELMPVNAFSGRFNWGYDGVDLFAPCQVYGRPDGLRALVDAAHRLGLGVILDVVYNHLGPDGNYLKQYAAGYFSAKYPKEWGEPINLEDDALPVRAFFVENARHWIAEYHLDGLRLDATQNLHDHTPRHLVAEIVAGAREAAGNRQILMIAESEPQEVKLVTPSEEGGMGCDGVWIDDFHHSARVAITGTAEAYLCDYLGSARELVACAHFNSLYQGQWYSWQKQPRGTPLGDLPAAKAVFFLQNHDQIANGLEGHRLHQLAGERRARAITTFFLLLPQTPLLFMGQEFFASAPFVFFADHASPLAEQVRQGRGEFLSQFPSAKHALEVEGYQLTHGEEAFRIAKLDWRERVAHAPALALHRTLLELRREDPVFALQDRSLLEGAALTEHSLILRFRGASEQEGERLVVLNLGREHPFAPCPEPLLAPVASTGCCMKGSPVMSPTRNAPTTFTASVE